MMKICSKCGRETAWTVRNNQETVCLSCYMANKDALKINQGLCKKRKHEEADIQTAFFKAFPLVFPHINPLLLLHIPNEGKRSNGANLVKQGMRRGVPDVLLSIPSGKFSCLWIEFKTEKGTMSTSQKEFQKAALDNGNDYFVARSASEALDYIKDYLKN